MSFNKQTHKKKKHPHHQNKAIESLNMQFLFWPSLNLERYSLPCMGFQALQLVKVEMGFAQFQILQN